MISGGGSLKIATGREHKKWREGGYPLENSTVWSICLLLQLAKGISLRLA